MRLTCDIDTKYNYGDAIVFKNYPSLSDYGIIVNTYLSTKDLEGKFCIMYKVLTDSNHNTKMAGSVKYIDINENDIIAKVDLGVLSELRKQFVEIYDTKAGDYND